MCYHSYIILLTFLVCIHSVVVFFDTLTTFFASLYKLYILDYLANQEIKKLEHVCC